MLLPDFMLSTDILSVNSVKSQLNALGDNWVN